MSNFEHLVDQVLAIDGSRSKSDILLDLQYTKSVELTVNRIFDGEFLKGTKGDPNASALIILDSDEEDNSIPTITQSNRKYSSNSSSSNLDNRNISPSTELRVESQKDHHNLSLDNFSDLDTEKVTKTSKLDTFSYSIDEDDDDLLIPSICSASSEKEESTMATTTKEKDLLDFDSDCESLPSMPSVNEFFDQLLSQKREKPIVEIDDDEDDYRVEEVPVVDRKGKRRAYETIENASSSSQRRRLLISDNEEEDWTWTLSAKEKKRMEGEERKRRQTETAEEKERRQIEAAEEKRRKKEEAAEEKKRLKEQKQLEKERQALFEKENRIRANRTEILKEMIVDIHPEFLKTKAGQLLERVLVKKEAQCYNLLLQDKNPQYTIAWRRICQSEWNSNSQAFIPLERTKIVKESVVLAYVDMAQFVQHIQADTVDDYIDQILQSSQDRQIMLLIEGLEVYYKKKMLHQRRQFESQVRSAIPTLQTPATQKRKINNSLADVADGPGQAEIEATLNYLQLMRHVMLVQTKDDEDTASWIESLTTDLALGRYKARNINNAYRVNKCGSDPKDTYFKMLQEVQLCTPAIAKSIMGAYPTIQSLSRAYERKSTTEGELLLANLEVERSALQVRDRKINRVMSKKMFAIFNSNDPEQIIF